MKKITKALLVILLGTAMLFAAAQNYDRTLILDDFNDAELKKSPEWWTFDGLKPTFAKGESAAQGANYLRVQGQTEDYYVGGMGFYFGKDASPYDAVTLEIKGSGTPAVLRIQLFDDDNANYELEQDKNFEPMYDDKWEHELTVDWTGWKTVEIPLSKFVLMNPGIGDGVLNTKTEKGSGGLLHVQLIFSLPGAVGSVDLGLDNFCLVRAKNK